MRHANLLWEVRTNPCHTDETPPLAAYCADGDGIVTVFAWGDRFTVEEQYEHVSAHDTLEDALDHAARILADDYPAIYEGALA